MARTTNAMTGPWSKGLHLRHMLAPTPLHFDPLQTYPLRREEPVAYSEARCLWTGDSGHCQAWPALWGQKSCPVRSTNGSADEILFQRKTSEKPEEDEAGERVGTGIENRFHHFQKPWWCFIVNSLFFFFKCIFSYIQNSKLPKISFHDESHSEQKRAAWFVFPWNQRHCSEETAFATQR